MPASAVIFDPGCSGFRIGLSFGTETLRFSTNDLTGEQTGLVTVEHIETSPIPRFPTLVDRVGQNLSVVVDSQNRGSRYPHVHVRRYFVELADMLHRYWPQQSGKLAIVVPSNATDLQKSTLVKEAAAVGWEMNSIRILNRTTAVASHALRHSPPGTYLVVTLGYSPVNITMVCWDGKELSPLWHSTHAELSGSELDRFVLDQMLRDVEEQSGHVPDIGLYDDRDWLWLRARAEQLRRRINLFDEVGIELPVELTEKSGVTARVRRKEWLEHMDSLCDELHRQIQAAIESASLKPASLNGCILAGGLLMQAGLLDRISRRMHIPLVSVCAPESVIDGAARIVSSESGREEPLTQGQVSKRTVSRSFQQAAVKLDNPPTWVPVASTVVNPFSEIRALWNAGSVDAARESLERVRRQYDAACALVASPPTHRGEPDSSGEPSPESDDSPMGADHPHEVEVTAEGATAEGTESPRSDSAGDSSNTSREVDSSPPENDLQTSLPDPAANADETSDEISDRRARRHYRVAAEQLRKNAQPLLLSDDRNDLEQAVRASHKAYEQSQDERILKAMIRVHLKAAARRAPEVKNFDDERRWLLCAFKDDPTDAMGLDIEAAVLDRFLVHAQQLAGYGSKESIALARKTLEELLRIVPTAEQARLRLTQLGHLPDADVVDRTPPPA